MCLHYQRSTPGCVAKVLQNQYPATKLAGSSNASESLTAGIMIVKLSIQWRLICSNTIVSQDARWSQLRLRSNLLIARWSVRPSWMLHLKRLTWRRSKRIKFTSKRLSVSVSCHRNSKSQEKRRGVVRHGPNWRIAMWPLHRKLLATLICSRNKAWANLLCEPWLACWWENQSFPR